MTYHASNKTENITLKSAQYRHKNLICVCWGEEGMGDVPLPFSGFLYFFTSVVKRMTACGHNIFP